MTGISWRMLAPALAAALAGCGAPSDNNAADVPANEPDTGADEIVPNPNASLTAPGAEAANAANPNGVALPMAPPAPSAFLHAAYQRVGSDWAPLLFLCDGAGGDRVKLVTIPSAREIATLWTYRKPDLSVGRATVWLSGEDAGAGQIMRGIERPNGGAIGSVHSVNPGMLGGVAETTLPTLSSITDGTESTQCRWEPRGRVLLIDARRSVLVTADADGSYTYKSFDHVRPGRVIDTGGSRTSTPTQTVHGGRLAPAKPGHEVYEFTNSEWTYRVDASADAKAPGATLTVLRGGKPVQSSVAVAYEMAAKRIE